MPPPTSPPPFPLEELCNRAISSPSSITPAERALLQGRPDPDTQKSLYIAKIGIPLSGLLAKALATPPTLTAQEAHVLVHGPVDRTREEKAARREARRALTNEQRDLEDRACMALGDKNEGKARNIAWQVLQSAKSEEKPPQTTGTVDPLQPGIQSGARSAESSTSLRRKPIIFPWERADWITPIREKNYSSWGLPVLRTAYEDPAAWLTFKEKFSALAAREITEIAGSPIAETFKVKYIEDENRLAGADQAGLLSNYARLLQGGMVEDGYSWGVFVSADENVLEIFGDSNRELIVPVWQANWKTGEVGAAGWRGALAVKAGMVFGILMPKLARGDREPLETLNMMAQDR